MPGVCLESFGTFAWLLYKRIALLCLEAREELVRFMCYSGTKGKGLGDPSHVHAKARQASEHLGASHCASHYGRASIHRLAGPSR